ncbi:TetR/AcrR family transcriptional regulator [soil metagenome]
MPTPDRTSLQQIVDAARDILEEEGLAGLTMQAVAERVGVRAPSLYKRVHGRDELVRLVAEATLLELTERAGPEHGAVELATALRAFAHERPAGYRLAFSPEAGVSAAAIAASSEPILRVATQLAGPEHALEAARTLTAWANGFIGMELSGSFNLGGDVERAWDYGLARLVEAIGASRGIA